MLRIIHTNQPDLTVGTILNHKGEEHSREIGKPFRLPPGGIAEVISAETISLPSNISVFAHLKTTLVDMGKFSMNVGIIDPGWSGPISSTILNLSGRDEVTIDFGEEFLRLAFFEHEVSSKYEEKSVERKKYILNKKQKIHHVFGEYFFGMDTILAKAREEIGQIFGKRTRTFLTWIALVLAASPFLIWGYEQIFTINRIELSGEYRSEVERARKINSEMGAALRQFRTQYDAEMKSVHETNEALTSSFKAQINELYLELEKSNQQLIELKNDVKNSAN